METDSRLRAELETAIAKVSRQIEIQEGSRNFAASGPSSRPALVEELQAELSQLEAALADLDSGKPPAEPPSAPPQETDASAAADTERGGVLIAMKARSVDPLVLGRFLLVLGSLGLVMSVAVALAHFVFGVPVHERGSRRVLSDREILEFLAVFASAFGFVAALAMVVLRDASRDMNKDLVR